MNNLPNADLVVIGGTGLYQLSQLEDTASLDLETPFGLLSSPIRLGVLNGRRIAFLARHGEQHSIPPHAINYQANIWAVAQLKPSAVLAVNAVGSMNDDMPPASVVLPDQILDYTWGRAHTFVGTSESVPMHVDFTRPYDSTLRNQLIAVSGDQFSATTATYAATQGPRLESSAEVKKLISDGADIVGMTGMPEAGLAREIGLAYASVAVVANWGAGFKPEFDEITMEEVMANLERGMVQISELLAALAAS